MRMRTFMRVRHRAHWGAWASRRNLGFCGGHIATALVRTLLASANDPRPLPVGEEIRRQRHRREHWRDRDEDRPANAREFAHVRPPFVKFRLAFAREAEP